MLNKRKAESVALKTMTKLEHLENLSELNAISLGEVANSGIFACKVNLALPGPMTSSIGVKKKRKIAVFYSYKEFH